MKLVEYLATKGVEESIETTNALIRCIEEGVFSIELKDGKTPQDEVGEEINDTMTFIRLIQEEGIEIPGIGQNEAMDTILADTVLRIKATFTEGAPSQEQMVTFLLGRAAEQSTLIGKALTKALTFGFESTDPRTSLKSTERIAVSISHFMATIRLLREEGVTIPGIGDEAYLAMRYEKAVTSAVAARDAGIIDDLHQTTVSLEEEEVPLPKDNVFEIIRSIAYDAASGGDAAPNNIEEEAIT